MATPVVCDGGETTCGMPSGIGLVVSVPFGIGPESRKPGAVMLIHYS